MSLRRLPRIENLARHDDGEDDLCPSDRELREWEARLSVRLKAPAEGASLDIFTPIGKNPFTGEGINAQDVTVFLKKATGDVTVNINSPGGSYFEGAAIYSLLLDHKGKVIVNVLGAAASAASLIAMAGDTIRISKGGAIMIHNSQAGVSGDRHDVAALADALEGIDDAIRSIYSARTGQTDAALDKMMTPAIGTWLFGQEAIDKGFADEMLADDATVEDKSQKTRTQSSTRSARAELDAHLSSRGLSRSRRRELLRDAFPEKLTMPPENEKPPAFAELASQIRDFKLPAFTVDTPRAVDDPATPRAGYSQALDNLSSLLGPQR